MVSIKFNARLLKYKYSGIQSYILNLVTSLSKFNNLNLTLIPSSRKNQNMNISSHTNLSLNYLNYSFKNNLKAFLFDNLYVNKYIECGDIYHNPAFFAPLTLKPGIKYIVTIHDLSIFHYKDRRVYPFYQYLYHKYSLPRTIKKKKVEIITDSEYTTKSLLETFKIEENRITTIYLGKDDYYSFMPDLVNLNKILSDFDIQSKYILSVCSSQRKNIEGIILAYNKLNQKIKREYQLIIVGFIDKQVKNMIINLNLDKNIKLFGFLEKEKMRKLFHNAVCFLFPSFYEGFGLPVLEAMGCGCPVITSNVTSLPEVGGNAVAYVDPYSIGDIANKLKEVLIDDEYRSQLRGLGFKQAEKFSWEKAARETLEVYLK